MALTDNDITAWATVAAVVAAVGVAWWGNRRSDRQTKQERDRADEQLSQERERSDRQRRIERNIALLVEVYDLHAEFKSPTPGPALFKLHPRLAVLPWTVATLIRFDIGETLLNDPESKRRWVAHRADRPDVQRGQVGFDLLKHEFPSDLWFLRNDQPYYENRFWWIAYEEEYPPDGGYLAPGAVSPKMSEF